MPIQQPLNIVDSGVLAGLTTPTLWVDGVKLRLTQAGWSVASGASGDWTLDSATFNANRMRLRVYQTGGNCGRLTAQKTDGTQAQTTDLFLLPGVSWRIIAYEMQLLTLVPGAAVARGFAFVSAPWTNTDVQGSPTPVIHAHSNSQSDVDATVRKSFRDTFTLDTGVAGGTGGIVYGNYNGTFYTVNNLAGVGSACLPTPRGGGGGAVPPGLRYKGPGSRWRITEAELAWGLSNVTPDVADTSGWAWGSFITAQDIGLDTTQEYPVGSGKIYLCVGRDLNGVSSPKGSWMVRIA